MRVITYARRCAREILRDPLNLFFGLGFPLLLLLLLSAIARGAPIALYEISSLAPGVAVFSLSFLALFAATLVARDRESALLIRLYATPMRAVDFILGYTLPLLPIALLQGTVCFLCAIPLGLPLSWKLPLALLCLFPVSWLWIALGLLLGSILSVKQVGGVCGALLTNLSAWLSGVWFDLALIGRGFSAFARLLPFSHAAQLVRAAVAGTLGDGLWHPVPILGYAAVISALAVLFFVRQMRKQ